MNAPSPLGRKVARPRTKQPRKASARKEKPAQSEAPVAPVTEVATPEVLPEAPAPIPPPAPEQEVKPEPQQEVPPPAEVAPEAPQTNERPHDHNHRRDRNERHQRREERREERSRHNRLQEMGPQTRGLTLLGAKTTVYSDQYTPAILEVFENRHPENDYFVKFNCPEFTSLCPITGQPDFATLYISYIPDRRMVESKSLKLYLFSFRNHGAFHEDCVNIILKDLVKLMSPRYIEVWGKFLPRGGLSIDPYANYGRPTTRWEEFARQRLLMHDLSPEMVNNR